MCGSVSAIAGILLQIVSNEVCSFLFELNELLLLRAYKMSYVL